MELHHIIFVLIVAAVVVTGALNTALAVKTMWVRGGGEASGGWVRGGLAVVLGMLGFVVWTGGVAWAYHGFGLPASISLGAILTGVGTLLGVALFVPPRHRPRRWARRRRRRTDPQAAVRDFEAWLDEDGPRL